MSERTDARRLEWRSEQTVAQRLAALDITLPDPPTPAASYVPARIAGCLLFVAGQLPFREGGLPRTGLLGAGIDLAAGRELTKLAALNALAVANATIGSLEQLSVAQLMVFVASTPAFVEQHLVADGASKLLLAVLGAEGEHARTVVPTPVLPLHSPVEVQVTFSIRSPQDTPIHKEGT